MNHKISTYILLAIAVIIGISIITNAITSQDVDEICQIPGTFLYRNATNWECVTITAYITSVNNTYFNVIAGKLNPIISAWPTGSGGINYTKYINSLNLSKLDKNDQRYNETNRINNLNASSVSINKVNWLNASLYTNDSKLNKKIINLNSTLLTKYYNITQDRTQDESLLKTIPSRQSLMYDELLYWATVRSPDMTCTALSSGTAAVTVPKDRRIGRVSFLDSTTANGGYICRTDVANLMYFTGYERLTFGFDIPNTANVLNTTIIMGFGDATAAGEPTDACYLYGGNRQLQGRCKNNAGPTKTSTNLTLRQNGDYLADISMNQGVTSALFKVYNYTSCTNYFEVQSGLFSSCTLLWSNTVQANIPNTATRAFGIEFYATQSSINAGSILVNWDFIKLEK